MVFNTVTRVLAIVLVSLVTLCHGQTNMTYTRIDPTTSAIPPRRWVPCLVYHQSAQALYLYGGRDSTSLGDLWRFDLTTRVWTELTSGSIVQPPPRWTPVCGFDERRQRMIMATGQNEQNNLNDAWSWTPATGQWQEIAAASTNKPAIRYGSIGGLSPEQDKFYVSQGFAGTRYDDTWAIDLTTDTWINVTPGGKKPHARCLHAGAVSGGNGRRLVIFGGCGSGGFGPCPADDTWSMDITPGNGGNGGGPWSKRAKCPAAAKYPAMAPHPTSPSTHMVLYGGSSEGGGGGRLAVLDLVTGDWTRYRPRADPATGTYPDSRQGTAMAWTATHGTVFFGGRLEDGPGGSSNDLWSITGDGGKTQILSGCLNKLSLFAIHGILMFLGWGFFLQIGALIARFGKAKDPLWFHLHRGIQSLGLVLALAGIVVAAIAQSKIGKLFIIPHHIIGIVIMIIGILQPVNAFFRPHKHKGEPISNARKYWQWLHWYGGRIALLLTIPQVFLGFNAIIAHPGFYIAFGIWCGLLFLLYVGCYLRPNHGLYVPIDDGAQGDDIELASVSNSHKTSPETTTTTTTTSKSTSGSGDKADSSSESS